MNFTNMMWVLIATMLIFFMHAGFTMLETGFTRSKNAGNIIMKTFMDFCVGALMFFIVGFGLMYGNSFMGFVGTTGFFNPDKLTTVPQFADLSPSIFILFQSVFCVTAATIVSGAVAERTKFIAYIIFSAGISLIIYPVVGHWIWGGGWLAQLGFIDFAGSTVVHSVGGWSALIGAIILGPRIGKYNKDGSANAIPGHSLTLGALGVFILWFGWFGFNAGSTLIVNEQIGHIAMTTNLSAVTGALTAMIITWFRYKKPDVGLTLNGALGGLVAVTAGCHIVTLWGAMAIGVIAAFVVIYATYFIENSLKIDDPIGAVAVHCMCGVSGTLLVGLFAASFSTGAVGLFYGGGFNLLGIQALGALATAVWTTSTAFIMFTIIKKTVGLRVSHIEEVEGLDIHEHGVESYIDFSSHMS